MRMTRAFFRSESGVAAIEFAFILPVMVIMFLGVVEVSNYVMAARRVANVASTAADLVAQDTFVSDDEMGDIMGALDVLIAPMNAENATIRITSVVADAQGVPKVDWSEARHTTPRAVGSTVSYSDIPTGLISANQSVIMTEIFFGYDPMFASFLPRPNINDKFYLKPRKSLTVDRGA